MYAYICQCYFITECNHFSNISNEIGPLQIGNEADIFVVCSLLLTLFGGYIAGQNDNQPDCHFI